MEAPDLDTAAMMLRETLLDMAKDDPDRAGVLADAAASVLDTAAKINDLKKQGYAPLSRFGKFTVDVVVDGERQYFGMFETKADSNRMAEKMRADLVAQTKQQQEEMIEQARRTIEGEKSAAIADLRREAVDLAIAGASRVIEQNLDSTGNRQIVESFLASLDGKAAR
jgi:vacuolar-type H+-ATPase subunit H